MVWLWQRWHAKALVLAFAVQLPSRCVLFQRSHEEDSASERGTETETNIACVKAKVRAKEVREETNIACVRAKVQVKEIQRRRQTWRVRER